MGGDHAGAAFRVGEAPAVATGPPARKFCENVAVGKAPVDSPAVVVTTGFGAVPSLA